MSENVNRTVYVIAGPTAVGKSAVGYYLAKRINGEIVNCDSVQLYRGLDIGSAKPGLAEMKAVKHHLYSIVDPDYPMSAAKYQALAFATIDNILARGKTPIVVGGTGLYLNALLYKMQFAAKPADLARRAELEEMAERMGNEYMFELLSAVDPDSAARIHPNNTRKIVRAIEAYEMGSKVDSMDRLERNTDYDFRLFGLTMERSWLYERINYRVYKLVKAGLVDEVKRLRKEGYDENASAMKGIGYKEILAYLAGRTTLKEAVYDVMKNTRHYAKRQLTWLRRYDDLHWIEVKKGESVGAVVDEILEIVEAPYDRNRT